MGEGLMLCRLGGRGEVLLFLVSSLGGEGCGFRRGWEERGAWALEDEAEYEVKRGETEKKQRVGWFAGSADSEIRTES